MSADSSNSTSERLIGESGSRLGGLRQKVRDAGPLGVARRGLGVVGLRRLRVFSRNTVDYPPAFSAVAGSDRFGEVLGPDSLDELLSLRADVPRAELERRFATGQICIGVFGAGGLLANRWLDLRRAELPYLGAAYELSDRSAYLYEVYTRPQARRSHLHHYAYEPMLELLAGAGIEHLLVTGLPENRAGTALILDAGHHPGGTVGSVGFGRHRLHWERGTSGDLGAVAAFQPSR